MPCVVSQTQTRQLFFFQKLKWTSTRLLIQAYLVFCLFSVVGGGVFFPLTTWLFMGDWRFWRYFRLGPRLYWYIVVSAVRIARSNGYAFVFSVPLTDPPRSQPDPANTRPRTDWPHGYSCGDCTKCCDVVSCPLVVNGKGCLGYDSLYWRYFNCGRFPASPKQLAYYDCPKWEVLA